MDGHGLDTTVVTASNEPHPGLYNDLDMNPIVSNRGLVNADAGGQARPEARPNDGIPRPPLDPLTTGQKVAGVFDAVGALGGSYLAISRFQNNGLHVLRADIQSLDKLVSSPELHQFRTVGGSLSRRIDALADGAQTDVISLQGAKPHLFDTYSSRGVFKGLNLKTPKYELMNTSEQAVMERAANLNYLAQSVHRGVNTSNTANFKSGLINLKGLDENPTAISEGLAPQLREVENLGGVVNEQVAKSTISIAAESRLVLLKNAGVVGLGLAANAVVEKTLLKDSSPKALTIATDCVSPFVVLSELPLWAKFSVIVGAHAAARLAEYGMSK